MSGHIYRLAACRGSSASSKNPVRTIETNIKRHGLALEALRRKANRSLLLQHPKFMGRMPMLPSAKMTTL